MKSEVKMKNKVHVYIALLMAFFVGSTFGCVPSSQYGKVGVGSRGGRSITIQQLHENWENYHVYYSGVHKTFLGGIMFDPKGDDKKLVGHRWWTEVKDQELLSELLIWISFHHWPPEVMQILGPDGQFYGYVYTTRSDVHIRKIDDRTLWVDELVEPYDVVKLEGAIM
jgi:hypothetical protein